MSGICFKIIQQEGKLGVAEVQWWVGVGVGGGGGVVSCRLVAIELDRLCGWLSVYMLKIPRSSQLHLKRERGLREIAHISACTFLVHRTK